MYLTGFSLPHTGESAKSELGSHSYPASYSAGGIPPEIPPVLITDKITSGEQTAAALPDSANNKGTLNTEGLQFQQDSASHQPTALRAAVPSTTDHGIAEADNSSSHQTESPQPAAPSSPLKTTSFLSRLLGGFMPSSASPAESMAERTGPSHVSDDPPSASWGRSTETEPVEQVRYAGTVKADDSGLDEPTATKQAGLEAANAGRPYESTLPNTAVAAAESLADTKADARHDTAAASQQAPRSPGVAEFVHV